MAFFTLSYGDERADEYGNEHCYADDYSNDGSGGWHKATPFPELPGNRRWL
jgi:hypothetical protein